MYNGLYHVMRTVIVFGLVFWLVCVNCIASINEAPMRFFSRPHTNTLPNTIFAPIIYYMCLFDSIDCSKFINSILRPATSKVL